MFTRALLASAATALALTMPVSGAGVVNVGADKVPDCPAMVTSSVDLDMSLAVLTPGDLCGNGMQPVVFQISPSDAPVAPAPVVAAPEPTLVASNETVVDDSVQTVVPSPRIVRGMTMPVVQKVAVPTPTIVPALSASLPKPSTSESPKFRSDVLWMIGVYR